MLLGETMTAIGHAWVSLVQSFAIIALVLTALGFMLGTVKPADALKNIGAILGMLILLLLIPCVLVSLCSAISLWQWIGLAVIGIGVWQWRRPRRRAPQKKAR
jgi:Na+/H+ antiporter NhaD/arsenite permease-like protein